MRRALITLFSPGVDIVVRNDCQSSFKLVPNPIGKRGKKNEDVWNFQVASKGIDPGRHPCAERQPLLIELFRKFDYFFLEQLCPEKFNQRANEAVEQQQTSVKGHIDVF